MPDILETPLPEDFYKADGWAKNLTDFYGTKQKKLPAEALEKAMDILAEAMLDVTYIYGKFPEIVYNSLGQVVDPMFYPEEYRTKVYKVLVDAGVAEDRPFLIQYAEGLLKIRCMFERDKDFFNRYFAEDIEKTPGEGGASKAEKFGAVIQEITKVHVNQVRRIIAERK